MSATIDERVVEMRFDNDNFERNARRTMSTLDQLKTALNMSSAVKNFNNISKAANNVDISGLEKTAEFLEKRFSKTGTAVHRVVENITDSVYHKVGNAFSFITNNIVQGGIERAMNVENARFQLQSLLRDNEKVEAIMEAAKDTVNDTAYSFDLAAKAASMFAASGITDIGQLHDSLQAMANATAAVNGDYASMSRIFSKIAGQGRMMGDELNQLAAQGMNPAAMIANYIRDIGEVAEVTEADVRKMVSEGKISFQLFANAMNYNYTGAAKRANETLKGSFDNLKSALKRIGESFTAPLVEQNSKVVELLNTMRMKVNDIKNALASGISDLGIGSLADRFSSKVLSMAGSLSEFIKNLDLEQPMRIFVNTIDTVGNLLKGIYSILSPIAKAFKDTFLTFSASDLGGLSGKLKLVTKYLYLTEEASSNLYDTVKGVTDMAHAVGYVLLELAKVVLPVTFDSFTDVGSCILTITGYLGRFLSKVAEFIEKSETVHSIIVAIGKIISIPIKWIGRIATSVEYIVKQINELGYVERIFKAIVDIFSTLASKIGPINIDLENFGDNFQNIFNQQAVNLIGKLADGLERLADFLKNADFTPINNAFNKIKDTFSSIVDGIKSFKSGSGSFDSSGDKLVEGSNKVGLAANILETAKTKMMAFFNYLKENVTAGSIFALVGSGTLVTSSVILTKAFSKFVEIFLPFRMIPSAVVGTLGELSKTLHSYQKNIKAKALIEVAKAIAIFAASIMLLTFRDTNDVLKAAGALSIIALTFSVSFAIIIKAMDKGSAAAAAVNKTADALRLSFYNVSSGIRDSMKIEAVGKMFKSFSAAMLMVVGGLIAVAAMYEHNRAAMDEAFRKLAITFGIFIGSITILSGISSFKFFARGAEKMADIAKSVAFLIASLAGLMVVFSGFFKVTIPSDWPKRLIIITLLLAEVEAMLVSLSALAKFTKKGSYLAAILPMIALIIGVGSLMKQVSRFLKISFPADAYKRLNFITVLIGNLELTLIAISAIASFGERNAIFRGARSTMLAISLTVLSVIGSLALLFHMKLPEEDLGKKILILAGILLTVSVIVGVLEKIAGQASNEAGIKGAAGAIMAMSFFLVSAVGTLAVLSILPMDKILEATKILGNILIALGLALVGAGQIHDPAAGKAVLAMIGIIGAITVSLSFLSFIEWDKLLDATFALSAVLLALAVTFSQVGKIYFKGPAATVGTMIGETIVIALSLALIARYDWERLLSASASLSLVLLSVSEAMNIISKSNRLDKKAFGSFLEAVFLLFSATIGLTILGNIGDGNWKKMISGAASLSVVLYMIGKVISDLSGREETIDPTAAIVDIFEFLGLVAPLTVMLLALGNVGEGNWAKMISGAAGLSIVLSSITNMLSSLSERENSIKITSIGTDLLESLSLLVPITGALWVLGNLGDGNWEKMVSGAASLSIVLYAVAKAFEILSDRDSFLEVASCGTDILEAFGLLIPITGALWVLGNLGNGSGQKMLLGAVSLSGVLLAMSLCFKIIESSPSNPTAMTSFLLMIIPMAAVCLALSLLSQFQFDSMLDMAISVSAVLLAMAGTMAIVSAVGSLAGVAIPGIAVLIIFIASMTLLIEIIGALMAIEGYKELIEDGGRGLYLIGEAIGKFVGGIVDGISIGAAKALENIGDGLSAFMEKAKPFFDGIKELPEGFLSSVGTLAAAVSLITAADFIDSIKKFITGKSSIETFATELSAAGPSLVSFADSVKGLDNTSIQAVNSAAGVIKIMADVAKEIPNQGISLLSLCVGDNKLSTFGEELAKFGPLLMEYAASVKGINTQVVEASAAAATTLSTFAKSIPNSGISLASLCVGDNKLSTFGEELAKFGPLLMEYATSISGLDTKSIGESASAAMMLSTLAKNLPNQGGLVSWITGDNKLSRFGLELVQFGPLLRLYAHEIRKIDSNAVKASAEAAKVLAELANNLPRKQLLIEKILLGDNSLSSFGKELVKFGKEISKYAKAVKNVDSNKFYQINDGLRAIMDMLSRLDSVNYDQIPKFVDAMNKLGTLSISEFSNAFNSETSSAFESINKFLSEMNTYLDRRGKEFKDQGENIVREIISGINDQKTLNQVQMSGKVICDAIQIGIGSKGLELYIIGKDITKQVSYGLSDKEVLESLKDISKELVNVVSRSIIDASDGENSPIVLSGMYMANGLVLGVEKYGNGAYQAGSMMGESYKNGLFDILGIHSPAAVGVDTGGHMADGIYEGSTSLATEKEVQDAGRALGTSFRTGIEDSLKGIPSMASSYGKDTANAFASGVENGIKKSGKQPLSALDKLSDDLKDAGKEVPTELQDAIEKTAEKYDPKEGEKNWIQSLIFGEGSAKDKVGKATSGIKKAVEEVISPFKQNLIDKFGSSFGDVFKDLVNSPTVKNIQDNASKLMTDMFGGAIPDLSEFANGFSESMNKQLEDSMNAMTVKMPEIGYNYGIAVNTMQKTNKKAVKNQDKFWGTMLEIQKTGINGAKYQSYDYLQYENEILNQTNSLLDSYSSKIAGDTKSWMNQVGLFDAVKGSINDTAKAIKDQISLFDEVTNKTKANRKAIMDQVGLFDSVANANKDRANSVMNQVGLFDAATAKSDDVTKESIAKNLSDQLTQYKEYRSIIYSLKKRIKDEDLIKYLSDLGVGSINELRAIYSMTDAELDNYVHLFQEKFRISGDIAADQLADGGEITKDVLKQNLEDQVRLYTDFRMTMQDARARIQNEDLLELLDGMTVANLAELKALNSMTDEELDEYIKLIEAKSNEAGNISMISGDTVEKTKKSLINNLNDQVDLYDEFYKNLKEMRAKDKNGDLSELLSGMTVNSIDELKALNAMTEEELEAYLKKYQEKWEKSRKIAKQQEKLAKQAENKISKEEILENQKDQIKLYKDFEGTYKNVMGRIADPQLREYIQGLGIDQIDVLKAIESMTGEELNQFVENFQKKQKICYELAKEGSKGLAADISAQLSEMFGGIDIDVEKFMKNYDGTIDSITSYIFNRIQATGDTKSLASTVSVLIGAFEKEMLLAKQQEKMAKAKKKAIKNSKSTKKEAKEAGKELGEKFVAGVEASEEKAKKAGKKASDGYVEGIKKNVDDNSSKKAGKKLGNQGVEGANSVEDTGGKWTKAGKNAGNGFIKGILSKTDQSTAAGRKIATAALKAAMAALDEHSPSKEFMMVGDFAGLGFVMGLLDYASRAENAGSNLGDSAVKGIQDSIQLMNDMIDDGYDITPVITPVVDMGGVYTSASEITDLFNSSIGLTGKNVMDTYGAFIGMKKGDEPTSGQNGNENGNTQNISFTQNNYSPKELSRIEIYRQTRNQLAQLKGV